jgi:hypothetical protein
VQIINAEMDHKTLAENKPGITVIKAYEGIQRNISG